MEDKVEDRVEDRVEDKVEEGLRLTMYMSWILLTSWEVSPSSPASRFLLVGGVRTRKKM